MIFSLLITATLGRPHQGGSKEFDFFTKGVPLQQEQMDTEEKLPVEREINLEAGEEAQLSSPEKRLWRMRPHRKSSAVEGGDILKQEQMDTEGKFTVAREVNLKAGEEAQLSSHKKRLWRMRPHRKSSAVEDGDILKQEQMDTEEKFPVERKLEFEEGNEALLVSPEKPYRWLTHFNGIQSGGR